VNERAVLTAEAERLTKLADDGPTPYRCDACGCDGSIPIAKLAEEYATRAAALAPTAGGADKSAAALALAEAAFAYDEASTLDLEEFQACWERYRDALAAYRAAARPAGGEQP
jgi:hypothetical protein